ncbi:MAG: hypothetical protein ACPGXY_04060 [Alphaproteobacteria bacterium]
MQSSVRNLLIILCLSLIAVNSDASRRIILLESIQESARRNLSMYAGKLKATVKRNHRYPRARRKGKSYFHERYLKKNCVFVLAEKVLVEGEIEVSPYTEQTVFSRANLGEEVGIVLREFDDFDPPIIVDQTSNWIELKIMQDQNGEWWPRSMYPGLPSGFDPKKCWD